VLSAKILEIFFTSGRQVIQKKEFLAKFDKLLPTFIDFESGTALESLREVLSKEIEQKDSVPYKNFIRRLNDTTGIPQARKRRSITDTDLTQILSESWTPDLTALIISEIFKFSGKNCLTLSIPVLESFFSIKPTFPTSTSPLYTTNSKSGPNNFGDSYYKDLYNGSIEEEASPSHDHNLSNITQNPNPQTPSLLTPTKL
jgi:hypothetical protein